MTMIADIQQGIVDKLAATFPGVTIYTEKVPQNFAEPSFRVKALAPGNTPGLGTRRWRTVPFDVLYFPASTDEPEAEWHEIVEKLFNEVEWITAGGDTMRGEDMSGEFDAEQEVGHFRVTFGAFIMDAHKPGDKMETVIQNSCKKGP